MRTIGFLGIALLACVNAIGLMLSIQSRDWRGTALMLFMAGLLTVFAATLWRGRKLEGRVGSGERLATGWYGRSVSDFFSNQLAKSPEGLILLVGSAISLTLAALSVATPTVIGLAENRGAANAVLFGMWPFLAFITFVRICGPDFNTSMFKVIAMLCVVAAPLFIAYR